MASGGSSVQSAAGSRSFDFGSDDVLCSFEEYTLQLDPTANVKCLASSAKEDLHDRAASSSTNVNGQPEEFLLDVVYIVEKCMKKYADNLTMQLEGISGRLTQLELYCYKLERSIGEFHTDMIRDQSKAGLKLKSLDKHVHEVHRSVQIIRDMQELSETRKELTNFQLSQKDSTNLGQSQISNEDLNASISSNKANYESNNVSNQPSALALPYQISSPPPSLAIVPPDKNHPEKELPEQQSLPVSLGVLPRDHNVQNQVNSYYYTHHQPLLMEQQSQNLQPELHYTQPRVKLQEQQPTQPPPFPQYQQLWSQPMQPSSQAQSHQFQTPPAFTSYAPNQHANRIPESHQSSSILLPSPYSAATQSESYGGSSNTISHLPPQHNKQRQPLPQASQAGSFAPPPLAHCGYVGTSTHPSQSNMLGYNAIYVIDVNRASHLQSCNLGTYPPNLISSNPPYGEVGYPRDQMVGIVFATAESG